MTIEINKLTEAVENKRQQMIENKAIEKRLLSELNTKFSISSFDKAQSFINDTKTSIIKIKKQRDELYVEFINEYKNELKIGE